MPLPSYGPADRAPFSRRQIGWYLSGRIIIAALILLSTFAYQKFNHTTLEFDPLHWLYLFALLFGVESLFAFSLSRFLQNVEILLQGQIVWDLLFTTLLVFITGGLESPFAFLYILVILSAAFFLQPRQTMIVAAASAIFYGSLIDLQFFGYLPSNAISQPTLHTVLYAVYANILAFLLTAFLGGILSSRYRRSEQALKEKEIDFEDLDRLNRAIVSNIGSGLMTINPDGEIRVFNQCAERITGKRQSEVYGKDVRVIFPNIELYNGEFIRTQRNEGIFINSDHKKLTLGFTTSLITGGVKKEDNLLVSFQDLTHLKEIEEQLRRSDRLAAVGQLAAGLAHEIRNPLASISGSLQLILEGGRIQNDEERLMQIVLREAERLNLLLSNFLRFARPTSPQIEKNDISLLLDELIEMAQSDNRFSHICFERDYKRTEFYYDCLQLRQALLNLLINAAESINGHGRIRLKVDTDNSSIRIEDSGAGFTDEAIKHLFNPFFTTKEFGTGLGLPTVHSIITAHQGKVEVEKSDLGGAAFIITLQKGP